MNGLALHIIHDSRDNPVNAYSGNYLNVFFRVNEVAFGSSQNSTMLYYDFRTYFSVRKQFPEM